MMDTFAEALRFTLSWEGGWVNNPDDPGGETYAGISRKSHPDWEGWKLLDTLADKDSAQELLAIPVAGFYRENYWLPAGCDQLPPKLAITLFDWAVHSGVGRAVNALQRIVGASPDGIFGPGTLASVTRYMDRTLAMDLHVARRRYIDRLSSTHFARGWTNRLNDLSTILSS